MVVKVGEMRTDAEGSVPICRTFALKTHGESHTRRQVESAVGDKGGQCANEAMAAKVGRAFRQ